MDAFSFLSLLSFSCTLLAVSEACSIETETGDFVFVSAVLAFTESIAVYSPHHSAGRTVGHELGLPLGGYLLHVFWTKYRHFEHIIRVGLAAQRRAVP